MGARKSWKKKANTTDSLKLRDSFWGGTKKSTCPNWKMLTQPSDGSGGQKDLRPLTLAQRKIGVKGADRALAGREGISLSK